MRDLAASEQLVHHRSSASENVRDVVNLEQLAGAGLVVIPARLSVLKEPEYEAGGSQSVHNFRLDNRAAARGRWHPGAVQHGFDGR